MPDTDAAAATAAAPVSAPSPTTGDRLKVLGQIVTRLDRLSTGDKIWLRDTLSAQIDDEL
jgi:hypothetical protein